MKKLTLCIGLGALPLLADFSYQEKSQMTGGAAVNMMKALGPFMKKAREPITSAVYIKGNKMANVSNDSAHIIDLDAETMTDINFQKRTYTVITFAQMKEAMEKAMARVQQQPQQPGQAAPNPKAKLELKIDVKETGQQKNIYGIDCKEVVMTTTMEATSTENGQKGTITTTMDVWVGPYPAGYKEVTDGGDDDESAVRLSGRRDGEGSAEAPGHARADSDADDWRRRWHGRRTIGQHRRAAAATTAGESSGQGQHRGCGTSGATRPDRVRRSGPPEEDRRYASATASRRSAATSATSGAG